MKLMCFELLWFAKKNQIHVFFKFFKLAKNQIHVLWAFLACKKLKFMCFERFNLALKSIFQKLENPEFSTKFFRECSFSFASGKSGNIDKNHVTKKLTLNMRRFPGSTFQIWLSELDSVLCSGIHFTIRGLLLRFEVRVNENKLAHIAFWSLFLIVTKLCCQKMKSSYFLTLSFAKKSNDWSSFF